MRTARWFFLYLFCLYAEAGDDVRPELTVVVAEFPPYIQDAGQQGFFIEILDEVANEASVTFDYLMVPWARAQRMVQGNSDYLIAPLTRTPAREPLYQWVIPVLSDPYYLYQLAEIKPSLAPEQSMVLVQRESPGLEYLKQQGYTNIYAVNNERLAARMLMNQRGTYWLAREMVAHYLSAEEALPPLQAGLKFETEAMYLGAGAGIDQAMVRRLQSAFDSIQRNGRYASILMRYQPAHEVAE